MWQQFLIPKLLPHPYKGSLAQLGFSTAVAKHFSRSILYNTQWSSKLSRLHSTGGHQDGLTQS